MPNVIVRLFDQSGNFAGHTTTAADGSYAFYSDETAGPLLPNTDYVVRVALGQPNGVLDNAFGPMQPTLRDAVLNNDVEDSDASFDSVNNDAVIAAARTGGFGTTRTGNDIGFVGPLVIGDYVW